MMVATQFCYSVIDWTSSKVGGVTLAKLPVSNELDQYSEYHKWLKPEQQKCQTLVQSKAGHFKRFSRLTHIYTYILVTQFIHIGDKQIFRNKCVHQCDYHQCGCSNTTVIHAWWNNIILSIMFCLLHRSWEPNDQPLFDNCHTIMPRSMYWEAVRRIIKRLENSEYTSK